MYDTYTRYIYISIHALRVEGDNRNKLDKSQCLLFQSTPSVWRATYRGKYAYLGIANISIHALRVEGDKFLAASIGFCCKISIHALRVEGDRDIQCRPFRHQDFNPRPPCGGRPIRYGIQTVINKFQSTPSVWRATQKQWLLQNHHNISIHALRVEGDT